MKKEIFIKGLLSDINKVLPIKESYELRQHGENVSITFDDSIENKIYKYLYDNKAVTITKDNIRLYYEFMSDEDKKDYRFLISPILFTRFYRISEMDFLSSLEPSEFSLITKDKNSGDLLIGSAIFNVWDTLKPIDEYIEEIKASEAYKAYVA